LRGRLIYVRRSYTVILRACIGLVAEKFEKVRVDFVKGKEVFGEAGPKNPLPISPVRHLLVTPKINERFDEPMSHGFKNCYNISRTDFL
jgi:hypothetical protein